MIRPHLWQRWVLIFVAFFASTKCSFLPRSLECRLQGASFGGRLVLRDEGGLGSGSFPHLAHRGRMIIFQTPPEHLRSRMAYGKGKIWTGRRTCLGSHSLPNHCPWTGDRPCLDKGKLCITEPPTYAQSHPLEFSEVTGDSVTVSWPAWDETSDNGLGPVTGYKILYRQQGGIFREISLDGNRFSYRFDGLTRGTVYQFRIVLIRESEPPEGPPSKIQNISTPCIKRPLNGVSFGGRLVFIDDGGLGSRILHSSAHRGQMIIFQMPPQHLRFHMSSGRGKIWIGSRNCQGSGSRPGHCPWTEDRPCLDKGISCVTESPTYSKSQPLEFSEVTDDSITVSWPAWNETTDLGVGPVNGYKILYRQLDGIFQEILLESNRLSHRFDGLTGGTIYQFRIVLVREGQPPEGPPSKLQNMTTHCSELGHVSLEVKSTARNNASQYSFLSLSWQLPSLTTGCDVTYQQITLRQLDFENCNSSFETQFEPIQAVPETGIRNKTFDKLDPYSSFNITYLARNPAGDYMTSQVHRTAETKPSGTPSNFRHNTKRTRIELHWNEPTCGGCNGEITKYVYIASKNGEQESERRKENPPWGAFIRHLSNGDEWEFKVKACNVAGCGPYAEASGVITN